MGQKVHPYGFRLVHQKNWHSKWYAKRDYAHLLVTMARAAAIPARFVSCFAPGVDPPDFHAVAEVFLANPAVPGGGA